MTTNLFALDEFPNRVAVSKTPNYIIGGTFFLDFSRELRTIRKLFSYSCPFGIPIGIAVPVVHQLDVKGGYEIGVSPTDAVYEQIKALWKERYPANAFEPTGEFDGLKIIADFGTQFPNDC